MIVAALTALEDQGSLARRPQPADGATYAKKIGKEEAALDWSKPASVLARQIRAFDPFPGALAQWNGSALEDLVGRTCRGTRRGIRGRARHSRLGGSAGDRVACGEQALRLTELQKPGGKRLPVRDFLAGVELGPGQVLANGAS